MRRSRRWRSPRRPAPAPAPVDVVVVAAPGRVDAAQRLTLRAGGTVGDSLEIVNGFTASVPRGAIARLQRSRAVRAVSRDGALELRSDPGADAAASSSEVLRTATGAGSSAFDGAGVGVALLDSGTVGLGGLGRPGTLVRGPDFSSEGDDRDLAGLEPSATARISPSTSSRSPSRSWTAPPGPRTTAR